MFYMCFSTDVEQSKPTRRHLDRWKPKTVNTGIINICIYSYVKFINIETIPLEHCVYINYAYTLNIIYYAYIIHAPDDLNISNMELRLTLQSDSNLFYSLIMYAFMQILIFEIFKYSLLMTLILRLYIILIYEHQSTVVHFCTCWLFTIL